MKLPLIRPIAPKKKEPFDEHEWLFELKYDGFRAVSYCSNGKCYLISKHDKRLSFSSLERKLGKCLKGREVILDGEVCALDKKGRATLSNLIKREGYIVYIAFDILWLDGNDLRDLPLIERKAILKKFASTEASCLQISPWIREKGIEFYRLICKHKLEGMIAKRIDGTYSERTPWYKIKNPNYKQNKNLPNFSRF
jgi:bifunctional non-homologous end joining protein LigD